MKLALFTIALAIFSFNCTLPGSYLFRAPSVPLAHQECSSNSNCVIIQLDCGDCDCGTPVNKNFELEYALKRRNAVPNIGGQYATFGVHRPYQYVRMENVLNSNTHNKRMQPDKTLVNLVARLRCYTLDDRPPGHE